MQELQVIPAPHAAKVLLFFFACSLQPGCRQEDRTHHVTDGGTESTLPIHGSLQPGDLLFQDLDCGPLCDAIEAVTEGVGGRDFSHVGMVVRAGDTLAVIEAIGTDVHLTSLADFHKRDPQMLVRHVKPTHRALADRAATLALALVGTPYDDAFLPGSDKLYCSEMIGLAYERANGGRTVFAAAPMTFKDPRTGSFFPAWVEYYAQLGIEIPEGVPGCNPGGLSRSGVFKE